MKSCLIIGAGEFSAERSRLPQASLIIAADAGCRYCDMLGISPDIIVGDFDSLGRVPIGENVIRLPVEKDDTDTASAVKIALAQGCDTIYIYGGTGGRIDHTLANIQLIIGLSKEGKRAYLCSADSVITAITDCSLHFDGSCSGTVSVFSAGDEARGVYEKGLKYPLNNALLTNSFPLGVSNEFTGEKAEISVEDGTLLIIYGQV